MSNKSKSNIFKYDHFRALYTQWEHDGETPEDKKLEEMFLETLFKTLVKDLATIKAAFCLQLTEQADHEQDPHWRCWISDDNFGAPSEKADGWLTNAKAFSISLHEDYHGINWNNHRDDYDGRISIQLTLPNVLEADEATDALELEMTKILLLALHRYKVAIVEFYHGWQTRYLDNAKILAKRPLARKAEEQK